MGSGRRGQREKSWRKGKPSRDLQHIPGEEEAQVRPESGVSVFEGWGVGRLVRKKETGSLARSMVAGQGEMVSN